jgi:hypothetical protein
VPLYNTPLRVALGNARARIMDARDDVQVALDAAPAEGADPQLMIYLQRALSRLDGMQTELAIPGEP